MISKRKITPTAIAFLGLILNFGVFYEWNHLVAIWTAVFIVSFYLFDLLSSQSVFWITGVLMVGLMISAIVPPMLPVETETHGWLIPANDPMPPNACAPYKQEIPSDALLVLFGDSVTVLGHLEKRDKKLPPLSIVRISDCSVLSIEKGPKGIRVNADIFADDGYLAARIKNNEFHLVSREISYTERNENDRSRIAVYDRDGNDMLWVRYINQQALKVRGVFRCHKSHPVQATKDKVIRQDPGLYSDSKMCINSYNDPNLLAVYVF